MLTAVGQGGRRRRTGQIHDEFGQKQRLIVSKAWFQIELYFCHGYKTAALLSGVSRSHRGVIKSIRYFPCNWNVENETTSLNFE